MMRRDPDEARRLSRPAMVLALALLCGCGGGGPTRGRVCTIDGGAAALTPLSLQASFGFSGCAPPDLRCTVSVDGGTLFIDATATLCSTGNNPGGVLPSVACAVPPLAPGLYTLSPQGGALEVLADGGGGLACTN